MRISYALASAMVALASTATAASPFDGFYLGANVGHNGTDIKVTENWTPATYDGFSADGIDYGVFAGFGRVVGSGLYLGIEAEAALSSAENKLADTTDTLKTEKEHSYGAALRAGYTMDKVMPYVRAGWNHAKYKQTLSGTLNATGDDSSDGLALGAGIEFMPCDNIAIRGEFVRTSYGKITDTDGVNTITYSPDENVARVGLSFIF